MVKYFAILAKALSFWLDFKQNDIVWLWNVSSLSTAIPKRSSKGLSSTVEHIKVTFSYGVTKNDFYLNLLRIHYVWTKQMYC